MLSRANHGADDANMPATIIAHTPIAITMLSRVILMADPSCLAVLLQNIVYPVTKVDHNQALNSSIEYGHDDEVVARTQIDPRERILPVPPCSLARGGRARHSVRAASVERRLCWDGLRVAAARTE